MPPESRPAHALPGGGAAGDARPIDPDRGTVSRAIAASRGVYTSNLAAIGIYGVLNYTVAERTREIGIRMALGASSQSVMRLVFKQGAHLTLLGLAAGLIVSLLFTRALSGLLFGVGATDAGTFASVIVVLALTGAMSTWLPVRRAVRIDPVALFRS